MFCWHKWKIHKEEPMKYVRERYDPSVRKFVVEDKNLDGIRYTLQCEKCGNLKQKDVV